ncbi:MAG TPA: hypothetical protein VFC39_03460, partial [Acidobacteriaceae bacterium]|nr:hypothetical protein [Acidobacteriaceae bacterium]
MSTAHAQNVFPSGGSSEWVDYAANQGVEWVLLTNGIMWRVYRVQFSKPIEHELVVEVNFCAISPKSARDLEC